MAETHTPDEFYGEVPPPRIIGTEAECTIQYPNKANVAKYDFIKGHVVQQAGLVAAKDHLSNGMRLYEDVGHLEIASAEALGPRDAVAADFAAFIALARIVERSEIPHLGMYRNAGVKMGLEETSSGYHENYLIPRSISASMLFDSVFTSHLASRIYSMAGMLRDNFELSQKQRGIGGKPFIYDPERRTKHGDKPMAGIPSRSNDSLVLGDQQWARVEVRYADAGFSATGRFLSLAATSLVLRLIEHSDKFDVTELEEYSFYKPEIITRAFSRDLTFNHTATTLNSRRLSAVDYQEMLALTAKELATKVRLPDDELEAIDLWIAICDELRAANLVAGEYGNLVTQLDFAARHRYLSRKFPPKALNSHNDEALEASLVWDRILPAGTGMYYWDQVGSPYLTNEKVEHLVYNPPLTRAAKRAKVIVGSEVEIRSITWNQAMLYDGVELNFFDPYATS